VIRRFSGRVQDLEARAADIERVRTLEASGITGVASGLAPPAFAVAPSAAPPPNWAAFMRAK
jgi:hypothetical protein